MTPSRIPPVPAVLRMVQRAVLGRWRATADDLYRELTRLTEAGPGKEILVAGCGDGATTEWLAEHTQAAVTGVDPDEDAISGAEERVRVATEPLPLHYEQAPLDDLPHETAVFDIAIGEPPVSAATDPEKAIAELVRVTRPLGAVVLLQPTWTSETPPERRELIVERLGLRPHLLVEWKQMMRDAGLVEIQVQDWTDGGPNAPPASATSPSPFNWRQKLHILGRAWRGLGWRGARDALARETTLVRELSRERAIGFQLLKGVKWPHPRET